MKNAAIFSLVLICLFSSRATIAATIVVDAPFSEPSCKLRDAIQTANTGVNYSGCTRTGNLAEAADTIMIGALALPGDAGAVSNYHDEESNLTGDFDIVSDITIQGLHVTRTSITAAPLDRLFDVKPGGKLTLRDLTLFGGSVIASTRPNGGVIYYATGSNGLILDRVYINGGLAQRGGAVYLNMNDNVAVTIHNTTIRGGYATLRGGALYMVGDGGGPTTELLNVTLSGNFADIAGAGLYDTAAHLRLRNSTITRNHGELAAVAVQSLPDGGLEFINSILMDNTTPTSRNANLYCTIDTSFVQFSNTVYGGETACNLSPGNGNSYTPLKLLPLFDYGSGIPTHALDVGSFAINSGSSVVANGCTATDARGVTRLGTCDMGAYEHNFDLAVSSTVDLPDSSPGDGLCKASNNVCTLRAAIMEAVATGGRRVITLAAGTYALSQPTVALNDGAGGDLDIIPSSNLNLPPLTIFILGLGNPSNTHIVGNGSDRVLEVRGHIKYEHEPDDHRWLSFALHNVTVRGGRLSTDPFMVPGLESPAGGGVLIRGGNALLHRVVVRDNEVEAANSDYSVMGGGVAAFVSRTTNWRAQQFSSVRLEQFTVKDNLAFSPSFEADPSNSGAGFGGGIYIDGPDLPLNNDDAISLVNGTVTDNHADIGGGILMRYKAYASFLTVTGNSSLGQGTPESTLDAGGVVVHGSNNRFRNNIIAGNFRGNQSSDCWTSGAINSLGYNLLGNAGTCVVSGDTTGNQINANPQFYAALNSEGATVYALLSASVAHQSIPLEYCSDEWNVGIYDDAIGNERPYGDATHCSMGATELFEFTPLIFKNGFE